VKTLLTLRMQLRWLLLIEMALTVTGAMLLWWLAYIAPALRR